MNARHAGVLAAELLDLERPELVDAAPGPGTERTLLRALESLLPDLDLEDRAAVTRCVEDGEERTYVLLLADSALYRLWLERPPGEAPRVAVDRAGRKGWRVRSVHEGVEPESEGGEPESRRGWALVFNDGLLTFVGRARPVSDAAERLGRALAALEGWAVDGEGPDGEARPA